MKKTKAHSKAILSICLAALLAIGPIALTGCDDVKTPEADDVTTTEIEDDVTTEDVVETITVTGENGEIYEVPDYSSDFSSELGKQIALTPGYASLREQYKGRTVDKYVGTEMNLTLDDYYKNHALGFSEWDIQNNTFIRSIGWDANNNVYIFLQANFDSKPELVEKIPLDSFYYNYYTLIKVSEVDSSIVDDISADVFGGTMIIKSLTNYEVLAEGFVHSDLHSYMPRTELSDSYPKSSTKYITAAAPDDHGETVTWYTMVEDMNNLEGGLKIYKSTNEPHDIWINAHEWAKDYFPNETINNYKGTHQIEDCIDLIEYKTFEIPRHYYKSNEIIGQIELN